METEFWCLIVTLFCPLLGQVVGINNLGYTCFLNSLLQALAACPSFIFWLQRQQEKKDKNFADTLLSILKSMILIWYL